MVDNIIDFDGFEKYGAPAGDYFSLVGNFLTSASSLTPIVSQSFYQEWSLITWSGNSSPVGLINGLGSTGGTAFFISPAFGNPIFVRRALPTNYSRIILGFAMMSNLGSITGVYITEGTSFTGQIFLGVDMIGRVVVIVGATTVYTSAPLVKVNTRHYYEIDTTINNTTGTYQIWLDGISLTTVTGTNTRGGTANNFTNGLVLTNNNNGVVAIDDMYWRDNTTGTATPFGDCTIQGLRPISDSAVQFTPGSILGPWYAQQSVTVSVFGGSILALVPVTPVVNMTVNSIGILTRSTSTVAKHRGVIYADSAGAPNTLLSGGTDITGHTSGVNLSLPLTTPQALTAGTQYWIGIMNDSSTTYQLSDTVSVIQGIQARTFSSGAPAGPLGAMTGGQNVIAIWGVCTSVASNYAGVNMSLPPQSAGVVLTGNQSSTATQEDLFNVPALTGTQTSIASVKISGNATKLNSGFRTMSLRIKSGATDAAGTNTTIAPLSTPTWFTTRFDTDPSTSAAWTSSGINNMKIGYKVDL